MKLISLAAAAVELGVAQSTMKTYIKEGCPVHGGKINLAEAQQWRLENRERTHSDQMTTLDAGDGENHGKEFAKHKTRKMKADADVVELKYQELLGNVIAADIALDLFCEEVRTIKSRFEQLHVKIAAKTYYLTDRLEQESIIKTEIQATLSELSIHAATPKKLSKAVNSIKNRGQNVDSNE